MPVCRAPFAESDSHYPVLDWARWISRRFAGKMPQLFGWWRQRLALCRVAGLPVCNAPEMPAAMVPSALDMLYARQLQRDSQLRWASPACRPDLGETSLALVDAQEASVDTVAWLLQGKDLSEGRGGGQVNNPGVYRSICLEMNLRTKLCICALQHARFLSDMEGGELSRKMIRKVATSGEVLGRNLDHTSEASVTSIESLVTMVQEISATRDAKEAEIVALRQSWASLSEEAKAAVKEAGVRLDIATDDDADFVEAMAKAGHPDARLAARLAELRSELDAQNKLLDGLYGWLASPTSLLYDAALMRKVHQYMDKVLHLLISELKKNGCSVIHASYTKVLFATGKLRVLPDVQLFWEALCENVQAIRPLEPLALSDASCLAELYYGVVWLDPANWAGVPIDGGTGEVIWKARSCWKLAEFLPPAVRPSLVLYAGDLLLGPQRELGRRFGTSTLCAAAEEEAEPGPEAPRAMDVDEVGPADCMEAEAESDEEPVGRCGAEQEEKAEAGEAGEASAAAAAAAASAAAAAAGKAPGDAGGADSATRNALVLQELSEWVKTEFFEDLRRRVLHYLDELQAQQQRELPGGLKGQSTRLMAPALGGELSESSGGESDEDEPAAQERKAERLRRHVERKWSFPDIPGRRAPPNSVEFEFMRSLIQIFQLEEWLGDQALALRDRMCQKLRLSTFAASAAFESPCFPLILRDLTCPWCCVASHVDVTSHATRGPGLWVCQNCERLYDKDAVQARLVGLFESQIQAWQSQEIVCTKCRRLKTTQMQNFCECYGRFTGRFTAGDFLLVVRVLRSLVVPHDLPWLGEVLDMHEGLLV